MATADTSLAKFERLHVEVQHAVKKAGETMLSREKRRLEMMCHIEEVAKLYDRDIMSRAMLEFTTVPSCDFGISSV